MYTRVLIPALLLAVLLSTGCGDPQQTQDVGATDATGASETLQQMLEVAEQGDWGAYVDRFYSERHKFGSPDDRDTLVQRFEGGWGAKVLPALQRATKQSPRIDGDQAIFADASGPILVLHRTESGGWGFHL